MGSGKTSVSELLHKRIKKLAYLGSDKIKWSQSDFSRTKKQNEIASDVVIAMAEVYIKNGMSILLTQNFIRADNRNKFISLAKKHKLNLKIYHLTAPRDVLLKRIKERSVMHEKRGMPPLSKTRVLRNLRMHNKNKYTSANIVDNAKKKIEEEE